MDPQKYGQIKKYYELEQILFTSRELDDYLRVCIREGDDMARLELVEEKEIEKAKSKGNLEVKLEAAKELLNIGYDFEFITKVTELTKQEIENL
jgi:predicted transposase/invertase (TIGR01784 family)